MNGESLEPNKSCPPAANGGKEGLRHYGPTVREAFVASLPVLMGYTTMGFAYGVLIATQVPGFHAGWAALASLCTVSGSMQFASVGMLRDAAQYSLLGTALLAFLINVRYCIYALPFLKTWRSYPWWLRAGLILGLTDETYAINCASKRHGRLQQCFVYCVTFFDIAYWIAGSVLGALLGNHLPFSTDGIEFAMLALFVVILTDLCRESKNWRPAIIGTAVTAATIATAMLFFPGTANKTLLIAIVFIVAFLLVPTRKTTGTKASRT